MLSELVPYAVPMQKEVASLSVAQRPANAALSAPPLYAGEPAPAFGMDDAGCTLDQLKAKYKLSVTGPISTAGSGKRVRFLKRIFTVAEDGILMQSDPKCLTKMIKLLNLCWTFHPNSLYHSIMLTCTQEERDPCQNTFGSRLKEKERRATKVSFV